MKKVCISLVAVFSFAIVSCKKDYTCTCNLTVRDVVADTLVSASSVTKKVTINDIEKDAKIVCNNGNRTELDTSGKFKTVVVCGL